MDEEEAKATVQVFVNGQASLEDLLVWLHAFIVDCLQTGHANPTSPLVHFWKYYLEEEAAESDGRVVPVSAASAVEDALSGERGQRVLNHHAVDLFHRLADKAT